LFKLLTIFILALFALGCSDNSKQKTSMDNLKSKWTEEQKRKYFQDSIAFRMYNGRHSGDSLNEFDNFSDRYYSNVKSKNRHDAFLYAFEEPWIDTTNIDSSKSWFRIIVLPCFRKPYCLTIEKKFNKTYLTSKMLNGDGGYYSGLLTFSFTKNFDSTLYNQVSGQLNSLKFWTLGDDTTCIGGFDGEGWTFEAIENGKYNFIRRWVPTSCGNSTTLQLGKLGLMLRDTSKMLNVLKVGLDKPENKFDNNDE
jgi:hypothetical protein